MKRNIFICRLTAGVKISSLLVSTSPKAKVRRILVEFLLNQLGFHHPEEIEFQHLHRLGKKGDRPRMIIARFLRYADRERVMKNAFKLKETDFKIFEDLPKELFSLRKKYLPAFYEAKKAGKKAVFSKSEPDKLFIDGKLVV